MFTITFLKGKKIIKIKLNSKLLYLFILQINKDYDKRIDYIII
jgi:hypothetical protein